MSQIIRSLTVVLEPDVGEEYAQRLIGNISLLKGVVRVVSTQHDSDHWVSDERARQELRKKIMDIIYPK